MHLISAKVGPYKSIDSPQEVEIEDGVTVLVGMNESGKTAFLQSLQKSADILESANFDPIDDYPRKSLNAYEKRHESNPETVTVLTYRLSDKEVAEVNLKLRTQLNPGFIFSRSHNYKNNITIMLNVDERPVIIALSKDASLSTDLRSAVATSTSIRNILERSKTLSLTEIDQKFVEGIKLRISKTKWENVIQYELWQWLNERMPRFLYFGDYEVLPSKMNLADLAARVATMEANPTGLTSEHRGIMALLRMANISLDAFANPGGLEPLISRIEAVSIALTDQIMEFWKQNEDLQVKIDIRADANDIAPCNNGPNIYIRIANNRHRGVTTPFKQRSRGFIWFFSFLVWFDSVSEQIESEGKKDRPLILLLDEPGLSLHALAQHDFLKYIDSLAKKHQVIYTTHSPFMIHSDRLSEVRVVEDRNKLGTVISDNVSWTDERTVFPLQAALGWTIAQNLFISERNLLVEGPADLVYLQTLSAILEAKGKVGLRGDVTIVPVGGLDKVVTFVALLGANKLKLVVFHDYSGAPEQKLVDLMRNKMISAKDVINASQFRDTKSLGISGRPTDTEDLFKPTLYLRYFNKAFSRQLGGSEVEESNLPPGDRIVDRLERYIADKGIRLRPSGGFNHYTPATTFAGHPPATVDGDTLARFEALFTAINARF